MLTGNAISPVAVRGGGATLDAQVAAVLAGKTAVLYDPSDLSTLYQESTGATPVAATDDPLGFLGDKSQGFALGTDQTDGILESATGWALQAGQAVSGGELVFVASSGIASKNVTITDNATHDVTVEITSYTSGDIQVSLNGGAYVEFDITGPGTYTRKVVSGNTLENIRIAAAGGSSTWALGAISTRPLSATAHAIQANAAARPAWKTDGTLRWIEPSGVDDWMVTSPLFDLTGEWWHVGAWRVDAADDYLFATTNGAAGGYRRKAGSTELQARNAADDGFVDLTGAIDWSTPKTIEIIQSAYGTNEVFVDGGASIGPVSVFDQSTQTRGLALFSAENDAFNAGMAGRCYVGFWGRGTLTTAERATLRALCDLRRGAA